jgi:flagellar motor switch/type III secretory pathway protein FliN
VDRALGDDGSLERMDGGLSPRDEMSLGVVAYVIARVVQALPGRLYVSDVQAMPSAWPSSNQHATCIDLPLLIDHQPVLLRAWVRGHDLTAGIAIFPRPRNPLLLRALLQERSVLSAQLIAPLEAPGSSELRIDDVWVLRGSGLRFTPQGVVGNVVLRVLGARQQYWQGALDSDRIELQERVTMKDDDITTAARETTLATTQTTTDLTPVADAPLELSVEIARFTLPLGEIATLCRGEVLITGKPVGQHVTLRAGSRAIAIAELVDVDGAIGVRIVDVVK